MKISFYTLVPKFLLLSVIGMPGLQRLIVLFSIEYFLGSHILGQVSNDLFLVQVIGFFSAIGYAGLVLTRVPKLSLVEARIFAGRAMLNMILATAFTMLVYWGLKHSKSLYDLQGTILLAFSWGGYQLSRHYYLAKKSHITILLQDFISLVTFCLTLYFVDFLSALERLSLAYFISSLIFFAKERKIYLCQRLNSKDNKKALELGGINFFGSGIVFLLVPLFNRVLGEEYAGLIGTSLAMLAVLQLFPRALAMHYLPEFSKKIAQNNTLYPLYREFAFYNWISLCLLGIVSWFVMLLAKEYFLDEIFSLEQASYFYFLLVIYTLTSQLALPRANILMAYEKTKAILNFSILQFIVICSALCYFSFNASAGINELIYFLYLLIISAVVKLFVIQKITGKLS